MILKITKLNFIKIDKKCLEQRIDNFLIKKFKNVPKGKLYNIIRKGRVRINKKRVKPKYKLKNTNKNFNKKFYQIILKNILYEDKFILVINKISGMSVHGGSGIKSGIIESIRLLRPKEKYFELIHRLDRYTSGILMIAKKKSSLLYFHKELREKSIKKEYLALVHGNVLFKKKTVSNYLFKKNSLNQKKIVVINSSGKKSQTIFITKKKTLNYSLMKIFPLTGRTHQIRVHSSHIGHPIVCDNRYGNNFLDNNFFIKKNNLLLHAKKITFTHPTLKKEITICAPLNKNFKKIIKKIFKF